MNPDAATLKIAVVAPIMVEHDGISLAAYENVRSLQDLPECSQVIHFGESNSFPDVGFRHVRHSGDLISNMDYLTCDIAIFHFGIYHSLFDALLMSSGPRIKIVQYHNVTPVEFVDPSYQDVVLRSLLQRENLRVAQEIWCDSEINKLDLLSIGFDERRLRVIPLTVEETRLTRLNEKSADSVNVVYLGRIVASKGIHDLLEAIQRSTLRDQSLMLHIIGNTTWSEKSYLELITAKISELRSRFEIVFLGNVPGETRDSILSSAHLLVIPSYHEGFCRPIVEGFRGGCIPIVYDAFNLPFIVAGLGRTVPTGSIDALSLIIDEVASSVLPAIVSPDTAVLRLEGGLMSAHQFSDAAHAYAATFANEAVSNLKADRLRRLLSQN